MPPSTAGRSPRHQPRPATILRHPSWSRDVGIYQLNQRHLTPEGTLRAAEAHLPRIRDLGAGIVWLMPVHPIGVVNRKGSLGSPYAVRDHWSVDPGLGSLDDLRRFVSTAHAMGLKVILDWVAHHTAWDHVLVEEHPDWFDRSWDGDFQPTPWWDWDDVIDLDLGRPEVREYLAGAMAHFVREADVDGFRCDVAGFVPLDFWEAVREELEEIKPVFLLAEWETRDLHVRAFDASYAWTWHGAMHAVARAGDGDLEPLRLYYAWNAKGWPRDAMRMTFVANHDINAFEGTEHELFGDALEAAVVLSVLGEGIPMVYSGQEAGSERRLRFFDKDEITWRAHPLGDLYRRLFALKRAHPALWNGAWGAPMQPVPTSARSVLAFVRRRDADVVLVVLNLGDEPVSTTLGPGPYDGVLRDAATGAEQVLATGAALSLPAWGHVVLTT